MKYLEWLAYFLLDWGFRLMPMNESSAVEGRYFLNDPSRSVHWCLFNEAHAGAGNTESKVSQ